MISDFNFESIFPVVLLKTKVNLPHQDIEEYIRKRLANHESYTSYFDNKFNDSIIEGLPHRRSLENAMKESAQLFLKEIGITASKHKQTLFYWFSVYQTRDDHVLHTHPHTLVAGTYYPYADDNSSKIRWRNPSATLITHSEPSGSSSNKVFYEHHPNTGEMNLWPAWLEHEVRPQKETPKEKARIAVSFNYGRP